MLKIVGMMYNSLIFPCWKEKCIYFSSFNYKELNIWIVINRFFGLERPNTASLDVGSQGRYSSKFGLRGKRKNASFCQTDVYFHIVKMVIKGKKAGRGGRGEGGNGLVSYHLAKLIFER